MKKSGFTLAEVLITLVIIGVIAAMTVPTLMNNTNSQEYRSGLKKAISSINQALALHYALEGTGAENFSDETEVVSGLFKKKMNIVDNGTYSDNYKIGDCEPDGTNSFVTQDGMIFCVMNWESGGTDSQDVACNAFNTRPCGPNAAPNLWIDVNGERKPNIVTTSSAHPRDQYQAQIYNQKAIPFGIPTQEVMYDKEVSTGT